jgi:hypothetical protein
LGRGRLAHGRQGIAAEAIRSRRPLEDAELDQEVRRRIKNLSEGTQAWDVEYARVMDQIKRKHGLDE